MPLNPTAYSASLQPLRYSQPGDIVFKRRLPQSDVFEEVILRPSVNGFLAFDANGQPATLTAAEMVEAAGALPASEKGADGGVAELDAAGSPVAPDARMATGHPLRCILCVGDSLTYGEVNGAQTAEPFPLLLASRLGFPARNKGVQGWIPRHRVWDLLIDEFPTILKTDLLDIPPTQYEDRELQPSTNNLRTFYADGKQVWMHTGSPSEATSLLYEYSAASTATADGDDVLMPSWVGAGANNPEYLTGRWLKQAGTFTPTTNNNSSSCDVVFWLGANGMEGDDMVYALKVLLRNLGPRLGRYWWVSLPNRQRYDADAQTIADWSEWTAAANEAMRRAFPGREIDIDGYFMGRGSFENFGNYLAADSNDSSDIALGVLPRSVKDNGTHFNALGYRHIAGVVANRIARESGLKNMVPVAMPNVIRLWSASGAVATGPDNRVAALANFGNLDTSTVLRPTTGTVGPELVRANGESVLKFDGTAELFNDYTSTQTQPNTLAMVIKLDALPASRADILEGDSPTVKEVVGVRDYTGSKRWHMFAGTDIDTNVAATTDDWHVVVAVFNGASSYFYLDGTEYGPFSAGTNAQGGFTVGSTAFPLNFRIAELVHYKAAADSAWVTAYTAAAVSRYSALLAP